MATCDSCRDPITWAQTEGRPGKPSRRIPLDQQPHEDGTYFLRPRGDGSFVAVFVPVEDRASVKRAHQLYRTHFASCPHAARHRRRR